jgi:hypothetical protein
MTPQQNDERLTAGANANFLKVTLTERVLPIVAFGLSVAALVLALSLRDYYQDQMRDAQAAHWEQMRSVNSDLEKYAREVRVLQQISMDRDAVLLRAGILQIGDSAAGPAYSITYKLPKERHQ